MKLHGHARLELTDVHTGKVEVVESDNLITNAVSDIFNGYGGSLNKAMLLWRGDTGYTDAPKDLVSMFYGGLLCTIPRWGPSRAPCLPRRLRAWWARRGAMSSTTTKTRPAAVPT